MAIFSDGWEVNQDFTTNWTASDTNGVSAVSVQSTIKHTGTYGAKCAMTTTEADYARWYKIITEQTPCYCRGYFYTDWIPATTGQNIRLYIFYNVDNGKAVAEAYITHDGTSAKWQIIYYDGTSATTVTAATGPSINTWYSTELYWKNHASTGECILYIDNSSVASATNKDTDNYGSVQRVYTGVCSRVGAVAFNLYADCFVIDSTYIGPEAVGGVTPISSRRSLMGLGRSIKTPTYQPKNLQFPKFNPKTM